MAARPAAPTAAGTGNSLSTMSDPLRLKATFEKRGPAGAFLLTDDQVAAVGGGRKAFPVTLAVNGGTFTLRLARMGGENMIGLRREVRESARLDFGDEVDIEVTLDEGARTVEVPDDLDSALTADPEARSAFDGLAYSHRKEYVRWVAEAKRPQTRADRIAKTVEMVRAGQTR